jgi:hypothetical protein
MEGVRGGTRPATRLGREPSVRQPGHPIPTAEFPKAGSAVEEGGRQLRSRPTKAYLSREEVTRLRVTSRGRIAVRGHAPDCVLGNDSQRPTAHRLPRCPRLGEEPRDFGRHALSNYRTTMRRRAVLQRTRQRHTTNPRTTALSQYPDPQGSGNVPC